MTVLAPPLDRISAVARPYPAYLLGGCETGLVLFAAAFLGHNDAIHFARNNILTTCVDRDANRLMDMAELYPDEWPFFAADAWEFAEEARENGMRWDVVSVDTFTGDATTRSLASLDLWCSIARKAVTATISDSESVVQAPDGWQASLFPRSDRVSWLVLERA